MSLPTRLSVFALLLVLAAPAWADFGPGRGRGPQRDAQSPPPPSTLPESVRRVENQTGGEVLRAEPMQRDGREVYRLKVLTTDGRVRVMQDDPRQYRGDDRPERRRDDDTQERGRNRDRAGDRSDSPPPPA